MWCDQCFVTEAHKSLPWPNQFHHQILQLNVYSAINLWCFLTAKFIFLFTISLTLLLKAYGHVRTEESIKGIKLEFLWAFEDIPTTVVLMGHLAKILSFHMTSNSHNFYVTVKTFSHSYASTSHVPTAVCTVTTHLFKTVFMSSQKL